VRGVGCALYTSNAGKPSADLYTGKGKTIKEKTPGRSTYSYVKRGRP